MFAAHIYINQVAQLLSQLTYSHQFCATTTQDKLLCMKCAANGWYFLYRSTFGFSRLRIKPLPGSLLGFGVMLFLFVLWLAELMLLHSTDFPINIMKLFMSKKGRKDKKELQESHYLQLNYVTVASLNATTYLTSFWNNTYSTWFPTGRQKQALGRVLGASLKSLDIPVRVFNSQHSLINFHFRPISVSEMDSKTVGNVLCMMMAPTDTLVFCS